MLLKPATYPWSTPMSSQIDKDVIGKIQVKIDNPGSKMLKSLNNASII